MAEPAISFLSGPNTNLYGRDPQGLNGAEGFPALQARRERHAALLGVRLDFRQSNHEGVLWIQEARGKTDGLIINAAGLT